MRCMIDTHCTLIIFVVILMCVLVMSCHIPSTFVIIMELSLHTYKSFKYVCMYSILSSLSLYTMVEILGFS